MHLKSLKILTLNCDSLVSLSRRLELKSILDRNQFDIVMLQETWLEKRHNFNFSNFNTLRTHSIKDVPQSIGTALLLNKKINNSRITIPLKHITYTAAVIKLNNTNSKLAVISIYLSSKLNAMQIKSDLDTLWDHLAKYEFFIVGGDFNARHITWDNESNTAGIYINNFINDNPGFVQICPENPTYQNISTIDHFIMSSSLILTGVYTNFTKQNIPSFSDHEGFSVTMNIKKTD